MWTCVRFVVPALFVGVFAFPTPSEGCAVIPPRGVVVEVATESAIIIWDEKAKTQHFIRRATFAATAPGEAPVKDFGFLVPTPSVPALEEADDKAFDGLAKITAPKIETRSPPSGGGCAMGCGMASAPKAAVGHADVEVLAEKHVAGYDAKVMKAGDSDALAAWLNERGYEVRPALARWLKPYLDKGWVVTAFKIAGTSSTGASTAVGSAAVRMSFTTEAPFFPYSEPDDMREAKTRRLFRVYAIANQKVAGGARDEGVVGGQHRVGREARCRRVEGRRRAFEDPGLGARRGNVAHRVRGRFFAAKGRERFNVRSGR